MLRRVSLDSPAEAIRVIKEDGGAILTGFADVKQIQQVNRDMEEHLMSSSNDNCHNGRSYQALLFGLNETVREKWLLQKNLLYLVNHFLRTVNPPYVDRNSAPGRTTDAILSQATTIISKPGAKAQGWHRDDSIWQKTHQSQEEAGYLMGSDLGIGLLVPGVNTTEENGATMFIRGSHLWSDERQPLPEECVAAEMKTGEAFFFLSSALHAGGANTTLEQRIVHAIFFCRSWVRPEANEFSWWTKGEVEKWSMEAQTLAGYVTDKMLGICNYQDPIDILRAK